MLLEKASNFWNFLLKSAEGLSDKKVSMILAFMMNLSTWLLVLLICWVILSIMLSVCISTWFCSGIETMWSKGLASGLVWVIGFYFFLILARLSMIVLLTLSELTFSSSSDTCWNFAT